MCGDAWEIRMQNNDTKTAFPYVRGCLRQAHVIHGDPRGVSVCAGMLVLRSSIIFRLRRRFRMCGDACIGIHETAMEIRAFPYVRGCLDFEFQPV